MEFWEDSTDKLATQFHILISKIFSFLRQFNIISTVPERSMFTHFSENHSVVSFIVYAVYTTTFFSVRYIPNWDVVSCISLTFLHTSIIIGY